MAQQAHWRDRAISASESISDTFDVFKAYGAHLANWVLFLCLIANLIEMVSPGFEAFAGLIIVGVQSISLDIAGFGLTAMAASAKRRGDEKSASKANAMGWTLISVMSITVGLITLAAFKPEWASGIELANQGLMFVRVIVTVFYGHIVHKLREQHTEHDSRVSSLEAEVSSLKGQLSTKEQEVSSVQSQVSSLQKALSSVQLRLDEKVDTLSSVQHKLDTAQQRVISLEAELESGQGGAVALRRELNTAKLDAEGLRIRLDTEQKLVSSLRRELSNVQSKLDAQASSVQPAKPSTGHKKLDTGQANKVDTGQEKIVQLDTHRKTGRGDQGLAEQIKQLIDSEPGISGRQIAQRVGCSPTTANDWKKFFEDGGQLPVTAVV